MTSNRIILGFLAIILLTIILLSSGRFRNLLRRNNSTQQEVKNAQTTITPVSETQNQQNNDESSDFTGTEIPATGPIPISYILLGGGLIGGLFINKFRG